MLYILLIPLEIYKKENLRDVKIFYILIDLVVTLKSNVDAFNHHYINVYYAEDKM